MKRTSCPSVALCLSAFLVAGAAAAESPDVNVNAKTASRANPTDDDSDNLTCRFIAVSARLQAAVVACGKRQFVLLKGDRMPGIDARVLAVSNEELLLEHVAKESTLLVRVPLGSAVPNVKSAAREASDIVVTVPFIQVRTVPESSK